MTGGDTKALNKMMEAGQLDPNELLPKMAAYMDKMAESNGAYGKALGSSIVAQGRMNFEFEKFVGIFSKSGGEAGFSKIFNSFATFFRENSELAAGLGEAWEKFGKIIDRTVQGVDNLLDGFSMLSQKIGISESDMALLSATALILATRFGRIAAAAGILFLVLEDISVGMKGGESFTKDLLEFLDENSWVKATAAVTGFALALGGIAAAIISIGGAMGGIPGAKGSGGKGLISAVVGSTVELVKRNPKTAAVVGGMIAYDQVASAYHSSDDPRVAEEREQIKMRIANLQRGPNAGYLTEMTNKYPLPGVNSPLSNNTTIEKVEIKVDGSKDPELVGQIVLKKIQELASDAVKNLPLTE